ncbi:ribosome-associated translation inhibitor RaiA [Zymomonas sp.]|uniref:ribosome hibernation-promoting factor, HPF/YfiA family n=1 Tax=Zymomonas sp. TaxID=2068624 RepID=UPI0025DD6E60|nr:ribosome-associated translation inhibitor RaiA [Zymomonas sp.]MCA1956415.1 ribosome-associated translation inhibitor RaiA [Zymomonas sp.]
MDIRISGHQIDTGAALREYVNDHLSQIVSKYFPKCLSASVTFGNRRHAIISCDIIIHAMRDIILKAGGIDKDAHAAFDQAAAKIEKQLRRHHRRLQTRIQQNTPSIDEAAITLTEAAAKADQDNAHYTVFDIEEDEKEQGDHPPVIAEMQVDIPTASVSDAVLMLDLRNTTALLFVNSKSGHHNMVYRRVDGTIGWVEPR